MLLCDYSNSFNFDRNEEQPRNKIGSSGEVNKENEKITVLCSRSQQNLEFSHLELFSRRRRQRNVPNIFFATLPSQSPLLKFARKKDKIYKKILLGVFCVVVKR